LLTVKSLFEFFSIALPLLALSFELNPNQFFAPILHLRDSILNSRPVRDGFDTAVWNFYSLCCDFGFIGHLPNVMGDESNELGLLGWTQLGVRDLLKSMLQTFAVFDEDVVSRDDYLAVILGLALTRGHSGFVIAIDSYGGCLYQVCVSEL